MKNLIKKAKEEKMWLYAKYGDKSWWSPKEMEDLINQGAKTTPNIYILRDVKELILKYKEEYEINIQLIKKRIRGIECH